MDTNIFREKKESFKARVPCLPCLPGDVSNVSTLSQDALYIAQSAAVTLHPASSIMVTSQDNGPHTKKFNMK